MSTVLLPVTIALGLGANLENPVGAIQDAVRQLVRAGLADVSVSSCYRTEPVDCQPGTPPFINAALTGLWPGTVRGLLRVCKEIEQGMGRPERHGQDEARIIDLDILLAGEVPVADPDLRIPHPRLRQRAFALAPLAEIAPDWVIPGTSQTVADAWRELASTIAPDWGRKVT